MRTKVTLVLLFLNVALFFFIFKFERGWRIEMASLEARKRVLGAEAANIQSLKISGPGVVQPVSLVKHPDGWYLAEPFEWPANPHAVSRIIYDLQFLEHETSFSVRDLAKNNQSLADYGLDKPSLVITFASADPSDPKAGGATPVTLRLGNKTKDGNLLYLLSPDGERVHVVRRDLAESLAQTIDQLRSETVFSIPVFEVQSFNLTATPANLRIRLRRAGNRWLFEAPVQARASKTETELAINDLNALRVKSFVTAALPDASRAANPTLRISLEGNNRSETLLLYSPVGGVPSTGTASPEAGNEYYARMESKGEGTATLFTVVLSDRLKDRLDNAQTELRDLHVLDFDPRTVTALTLEAPGQPELTLQSLESLPGPGDTAKTPAAADAAWQIVRRNAPQGLQTQPADGQVIQRVLEQLAQLSAKNSRSFLSDAPTSEALENWGFNRPERTVTLTLAHAPSAAARTIKLELGAGNAGGSSAFARVGGSGSVYEVDPEILRETPVDPLGYRDRLLRELPPGAQITALRLTDITSKAVLFERQISPTAKDDAVKTLVGQLAVLRAKAFVSDQFVPNVMADGEVRPWKYQLDATITLVSGAAGPQTSTTTLFLTDRLGGNRQLAGSSSPEFNGVWELEQPFVDALWTLTYGARDPGAPPPDPKPDEPAAPAIPPKT
jgi:hypothetical protein